MQLLLCLVCPAKKLFWVPGGRSSFAWNEDTLLNRTLYSVQWRWSLPHDFLHNSIVVAWRWGRRFGRGEWWEAILPSFPILLCCLGRRLVSLMVKLCFWVVRFQQPWEAIGTQEYPDTGCNTINLRYITWETQGSDPILIIPHSS